jgi:hypothetical protein
MSEGKFSYEKDLWDGINIVNNRCEEAKNALTDIIKLLDTRATLETDYSKKLQQLCSKPSTTPEGRSVIDDLTLTRTKHVDDIFYFENQNFGKSMASVSTK